MGATADRSPTQVDVLGPIRVVDASGAEVTPGGPLQRRLLALLVLRRDQVVTADEAVEALWPSPERRPADAAGALQNQVFRLRRALPRLTITSAGDGYCLASAGIEVDADVLAGALSAGALGADRLDAVLERWPGGGAYPELADTDDGRIEAARLDELRVRALEARAEARLTAGDATGVVPDLARLVDELPLRERPVALLMDALARAGRRVDALRAYDDFRRRLGDELGIEPSPALSEQHATLLAGGPVERDVDVSGAPVEGDLDGDARRDVGSPVGGEATWAPPTRLPAPAQSLIGRESLVADLTATVEDHRLVTLVGPGGVGKTRLAIEVGRRLRDARPDRPVVLCELATAVEESAVDVVTAALAIDARPGVDPVQRVARVLGEREVVVVLDNCEHVLDPVAELAGHLLAECPNVTLVATSQERLRVPGEQLWPVPPLVLDTEDAPAVALFAERARAVLPTFDPDAAELAGIVDIVRRLDGLPLAIELAAARLHTHDVSEIAAGLDSRFALLSEGYRSSARHGSLHAAVGWSFGLLDAPRQRTFADLSVFAGSFTAADAAAICALDEPTVAAHLAQLVERSLVTRAGRGRHGLLETLRAFGAQHLVAEGRAAEVSDRHARHQVDWIEQADAQMLDPGRAVVSEIDAALPELRSALSWLLDHGEVELAGRLVVALLDYGIMRLRPDVLSWSERVAAADPDDASPRAASVWVAAAYAAWMAGDVEGCGARAARALRVAESAGGDPPAEVAAICGNHALFEGRLDEAARWYRRSMDLAAAADDPAQRRFMAATELLALAYAGDSSAADRAASLLAEDGEAATPHAAYLWYCAGEADLATDVDRARTRYARAEELAELTNASFVTGLAGASRVSIDARLGDPATAARDYRRLIDHWRRAGMWSTQWTMLRSIAGLLARLDRPRDAAVLVGAVRAPGAGHRIFGADEVALTELGDQLRAALGADAYREALDEGAALDGDAAVEHALRAL